MKARKDVIVKYKVMAEWTRPGNYLIFDTKEEAKEWIGKVGKNLKITPVEGKIVSGFQATSGLFGGTMGIYGRSVKVWKPLSELSEKRRHKRK
jgi:hypothetical protein